MSQPVGADPDENSVSSLRARIVKLGAENAKLRAVVDAARAYVAASCDADHEPHGTVLVLGNAIAALDAEKP